MLRRSVPFLLLLLLLAPARADVPPDLARLIREGQLAPSEALLALREAGVDPAGARELLSAPGSGGTSELRQATLVDRQGRKTTLEVRAPEAAPPARGYPVVIALHGLRGEGRQLLPLARKLAPPEALLLAPSAQYLPAEAENEDMWEELGKPVEEAPEDDPAARRRERFQRLLRLARDQVFPHWWSYKDDAFPLQALAWARQRWPIDPDRVVLLGYSMGGYGTWNVGLRYPDRFAGIVPIAGGISRRENTGPRDEVSRALLGNARALPSFFLHGSADPIVPVRFSRTIHEELSALGAPHEYIEVPQEGHHLRAFLEGDDSTERLRAWIAERRRDAHPRRVDHTAVGAYQGASYWVRVDALRGQTARVEAEVLSATGESGQRIRLRTRGVASLTVWLDPALLDPTAPVTVELDGAVVHEGPVAPSLEAVLESWGTRRDPSLVYERMLRLEAPAPAPTPRSF